MKEFLTSLQFVEEVAELEDEMSFGRIGGTDPSGFHIHDIPEIVENVKLLDGDSFHWCPFESLTSIPQSMPTVKKFDIAGDSLYASDVVSRVKR